MKTYIYRLLGIATLSTTLATPQAIADSIDDSSASEIGVVSIDESEIVAKHLHTDTVNALKTPTQIIDVPQSLTIVTADQIAEQGFTSIGDIVDYTPGVNTSQGEGHRDAVVFRGVRSTADFYIDGFRDDVQYYRPLYNLEQVEILRGPNALLFGRGGTGGILNRVTKKGILGETFTGYKASVDTFGAFGIELDSNFAINENAAFRVNAMYESLDNHRDFYDGDRFGVNPTIRFELTERTTLDVSYEYIDHERFIDRGIPTGTNGRPVEAFEDIVFGDPELNTSTLEAHTIRATVQHNFLDNLKGNFSAFYGYYDKFYENFYASAYDQATTPNEVTLDGYVDTSERENLILSGNLVGEFFTGDFGHTVIGGTEYINTSSDQDRFNADWNPDPNIDQDTQMFTINRPLNLSGGTGINSSNAAVTNDFTSDLNDDTRVSIDVYSFYVQDQIEISEMFDLVLGARFDSFDIEVNNVDPNSSSFGVRSRKDEEISPRAGLIFKPKENISIYGSYSKSFLPRSGEQFANINGANNQLDPDEFTNLEAGIKWDIQPGLSLTTSIFQVEQKTPVVSDNDPSTLDVIELEVQGFEAQLQGRVTEKWYLSAGYSYLEGENGDTGNTPRELPEHMFSLWNTYRFTEQFGLGAGLIYQDESFINNSNTAVLPSYVRVDAAVYYKVSDNLRVQLNIENLTDELYFPNAHSTHQATVGAPINARLSITGRF